MKIKHLLSALLLFFCAAAHAQMEPLPVDTAVRMGKLDNGLTYFIRYNNWPEHRANFYIAQKVGSLEEEESQRGLAHFLEHMAFNGSDNFKGNSLIEWCRTQGIEFGGDLNAYTSIEETVYNIDNVPTTRQSALDSCLLILRDWSCGLLLEQDEIDKERGVIHEEWRLRTSAINRMLERNLESLYPGSKYGLRFPIGLMSVVDNFKRQELVDYYHKWYHPANQGIIVVGDVDVDHVEAEIKRLFGDIKTPDNPAALVVEQVPDNAEPIVVIDKDKEFQQTIIELMMKHDVFPKEMKQTPAYYVQEYLRSALSTMLAARFTEEAQKADCPFVGAQAEDGAYIFAKTKDAFSVSVTPKQPSMSREALKAALLVVRKAAEYGFTATEYARFQQNMLSSLDKMYSNKDKRYTSQFYNEIKGYFLDNEPMADIDTYYMMMKQIVPNVPLEAINAGLKELFNLQDSNLVILNFNNEKEDAVYPTRDDLLGAVQDARSAEIEAYVDNVKDEPLIAQLPEAGKIVKEEKNEKFDYTKLSLSNGVTVMLKKTDFKKDQVLMKGSGGQGFSVYGQSDFANIETFDDVIGFSGLGNFSSTELQKALAGKIANANLKMDERRMTIDGNATPKDVETMLQMAYLYFTGINKDSDSFASLMQQYEVMLKNRDLSPETALGDSISAALYGHGWRTEPLLLKDLENVSYDRILQMAQERTADANGWVFYIIGNYDEETIRPLVCQYLGALPSQKKGDNVASQRVNRTTDQNVDNHFTRKMETPKANAYVFWLNKTMPYSQEDAIKADIAGQVLEMIYLKEIREEASAAYSVGARGSMNHADDGYHIAQVMAVCPMKPEKRDIAVKIMEEAAQQLAKSCDAEMVEKVKLLMLKQADTSMKTNAYWMGVISAEYRLNEDTHTRYKSIVESITPESISQWMAEFMKGANKVSVIMMPEE